MYVAGARIGVRAHGYGLAGGVAFVTVIGRQEIISLALGWTTLVGGILPPSPTTDPGSLPDRRGQHLLCIRLAHLPILTAVPI